MFAQTNTKLAKAITTLGNTYRACGATAPNRSLLFDGLYEPVHSKQETAIDRMDGHKLQKITDSLSDRSLWPSISANLPDFERIALKELRLAARMDALAAERAIAVQHIRSGRIVQRSRLVRLARQIESMAERFSDLWHLRNKRSRLSDNIRLFRKIQRQMLVIADKQ